MKFENVKVRSSVQVINIGQPERWNVFETNIILEEGDTFEEACDAGVEKIQAAHDKYSKSFVEPDISFTTIPRKRIGVKLNPDADTRLKYAKAAADSDHNTISLLEELYNFQIG